MRAIWDNVRAVDLLQSMGEVDGERIGAIGHSLGGAQTRCSRRCLSRGSRRGRVELRVDAVSQVQGREPGGVDEQPIHAADRRRVSQQPGRDAV